MAAVTVTWKDEGRYGPCVVTDTKKYAAWRKKMGIKPGGFGIPFGSKPEGVTEKWMTLAQARAVAKRHGVKLVIG